MDDGLNSVLYVGGTFVGAGETSAKNIAQWDGSSWSTLADGLEQPNSGYIPFVTTLLYFDDGFGSALYAGGNFSMPGKRISTGLAKWDGSTWIGLVRLIAYAGPNGSVFNLIEFDDGCGTLLYASGDFYRGQSTVGRQWVLLQNILKWDGATLSPLASGLNNPVRALALFDDGFGTALHVGGTFNHASGQAAECLARWGYQFGDVNCDGRINSLDIDPFVLALTDPGAYEVTYQHCDIRLADLTRDGEVTEADIEPFISAMVGF